MKRGFSETPFINYALVPIILVISALLFSCKPGPNSVSGKNSKNFSAIRLDSIFVHNYLNSLQPNRTVDSLVWEIYHSNNYQLSWFTASELVPAADTLMMELIFAKAMLDYPCRNCELLPQPVNNYRVFSAQIPADSIKQLDLHLTLQFLYLQCFHHFYIIPPDSFESEWTIPYRIPEFKFTLSDFIREPDSRKLKPANEQYLHLEKAMVALTHIKGSGGWKAIPGDEKLEPGNKYAVIPILRERLSASGEYNKKSAPADVLMYDSLLVEAVKLFQIRHGLKEDGIIGRSTYAALNVPVEQRIEQIKANMERWRWLTPVLPEKYIFVNIPEHKLYYRFGDSLIIEMIVVVGKKRTATPVFMDTMEYLILSPYWHVPASIAKGEILPQLKQGSDYLADNHMEVLLEGVKVHPDSVDWKLVSGGNMKYKFRQKPGNFNSLGTIKFIFPNKHYVYLHDTNAKSYFNRADRAQSHGCVRISKPVELAEILLADKPEWTVEKINEKRLGGKQVRVDLENPLMVFMAYFTCKADKKGTPYFWDDVYDLDRPLIEQLQKINSAQSLQQVTVSDIP